MNPDLEPFLVFTVDGLIDQEGSIENFRSFAQAQVAHQDYLVAEVLKVCQQQCQEHSTEFVTLENMAYAARCALTELNIQITPHELDKIFLLLIKKKLLISRIGRSGGVQFLDNAVQIMARSAARDGEVTKELINQTMNKILMKD